MQPNAHAMAGSMRRRAPTPACQTRRRDAREPARQPYRSSRLRMRSSRTDAEADGGHQHHALEQRLPQRLDVEHEQQVADRAEHQRAEDRADRAARAAEQRHAAQHHGGDRIQRVGAAVGGRRLARIGDEREEEPGDRREQARQRVRDELGATDRHAGHVRGDLGRSDRVDRAADDRAPERQPHDHAPAPAAARGSPARRRATGRSARRPARH